MSNLSVRCYLDTNAFRDFLEPRKGSESTELGLTWLRAAIHTAVNQDAVVILASLYHLRSSFHQGAAKRSAVS